MKFYLYIFYRLGKLYTNKNLSYALTHTLFIALANIATVISICAKFCFHTKIPYFNYLLCFGLLVVFILWLFMNEDELFSELEKEYQNEAHALIKGIGVGVYIILSIILFLITY